MIKFIAEFIKFCKLIHKVETVGGYSFLFTISLFVNYLTLSRWQVNQHSDSKDTGAAATSTSTSTAANAGSSADTKDKDKDKDKDKLTKVSVTLSR